MCKTIECFDLILVIRVIDRNIKNKKTAQPPLVRHATRPFRTRSQTSCSPAAPPSLLPTSSHPWNGSWRGRCFLFQSFPSPAFSSSDRSVPPCVSLDLSHLHRETAHSQTDSLGRAKMSHRWLRPPVHRNTHPPRLRFYLIPSGHTRLRAVQKPEHLSRLL